MCVCVKLYVIFYISYYVVVIDLWFVKHVVVIDLWFVKHVVVIDLWFVKPIVVIDLWFVKPGPVLKPGPVFLTLLVVALKL